MSCGRSSVAWGLGLLLSLAAFAVFLRPPGDRPVEAPVVPRIDERQPALLAARFAASARALREPLVVGGDPRATARLHGVVRSADGAVVRSGSVTLRGAAAHVRVVELGGDGAFSLEGLEPGTWQLLVRGPDCATTSLFVEDLARGEDRQQDILVVRGPRLRGEVLDPEGRPLSGVCVTPWRRGPDGDEIDPRTAVETDRGGLFEVGVGEDAWCLVRFAADGYHTRSVRLSAGRFAQVRLDPSGR